MDHLSKTTSTLETLTFKTHEKWPEEDITQLAIYAIDIILFILLIYLLCFRLYLKITRQKYGDYL